MRDALEPLVAQVYFSPECHQNYVDLGFDASPGTVAGVALPDGAAYFTSRGSALGDVDGSVVAAAFGVFDPAAVVPLVAEGRRRADASTMAGARTAGAVAQLRRVLGDPPEAAEVADALRRSVETSHRGGRPLFAGLLAVVPGDDPLEELWRAGDLWRELRGDAHNAAWTTAGLDPIEIGLLTEAWWGLPLRSYVRTRAWSDDALAAGVDRLTGRGLIADGALTDEGRELREEIETSTDRQMAPAVDALGEDLDRVVDTTSGWSRALVSANAYPRGPAQLTERRTAADTTSDRAAD